MLIQETEAYLKKADMTPSSFGLRVANDHHLVNRIRAGSISMKNAEKVEQYMAENPPSLQCWQLSAGGQPDPNATQQRAVRFPRDHER